MYVSIILWVLDFEIDNLHDCVCVCKLIAWYSSQREVIHIARSGREAGREEEEAMYAHQLHC